MEKEKISKRKKAIYFIGVTGGVYLAFQYLLPLVIPFLIAYLGACLMEPCIRFLEKRLHIKRIIAVIIVVLFILGMLGTAGVWLIQRLIEQTIHFISAFPSIEGLLLGKISGICCEIEKNFGLQENTVQDFVHLGMIQMSQKLEREAMPFVVSGSVPVVKWIIEAIAVLFIIIVSMILISKDYLLLKEKKEHFIFAEEIALIGGKLSAAGGAYVKTQCIIMLITTVVCVIGLTLLGNPYALLIGVFIGAMDALPLLGSGLIFIPWILFSALLGSWRDFIFLAVIYLICYFTREFLEPKLMGRQIGISSLEMIISMYIGLKLFGLAGVLLGPVGYLLIIEIMWQIQNI